MYRFLFFIILSELNFALKVYRKSTPNPQVDDYLVQEVNFTDHYMDYNIPYSRTTRARTTQARTTQARTTQARTTQARTTQARTTQANTTQDNTSQNTTTRPTITRTSTTQASTTLPSTLPEEHETSPEPTITTSAPTPPPTSTSFKPIDYLVTMSPEQIYDVYSDLEALNKTIVDQTIFMYGEDRPDKYKYVQILLWGYFKSIVKRYYTPENTTYDGNTPPIEDYLQDNTQKYPSTTTKIQFRSTTKYFRHPTYKNENKTFDVGSTLRPVTQRTEGPLTTLLLTKPPGRQGPRYSTSTYNQHQPPYRTNIDRRPTQYPSIKLPQNKYYPSTPSRQNKYKKMSYGQQNIQWTQPGRIGVNVIRQGTETSVDPAYYDVDATTAGHHVYTEPGLDSLIYAITTPPPPSSDGPIVKDAKTIMGTKKEGYFTAFVQELCTIIAVKDPLQSKDLYLALDQVMATMMSQEGLFVEFGIKFETTVFSMIRKLIALEPGIIQSYASIAISALEEKEVALAEDLLTLLKDIDYIFSFEEGEALLNTLVGVEEYPKNDSAYVVVENVVKKVFKPYFRLAGSQTRQFLIQSINSVMSKRSLGRRRRIGDLDDKMFEKVYAKKHIDKSGFDKEIISVDDRKCKITTSITKLSGMERNDVIVKELIEHVKIMEAIKKYKTKIVQTTAKSWPKHYKRASFDEIQPKNKKTTNVNFIDKKDQMANLDDEVIKYKLKTKQNAKIKNVKESRKILYSEMTAETDQLSGSTSESESVLKTRRNKLDKYMKHKIKNHLIRNHVKLHKNLYKSHRRNEETQMNIKNKVLRKNDGQNRFKEVKKHDKELSFQDKTRARDNERPSYNMRHSNEENRHLPGYRRHYGNKRRPPGAKRRPSDSITRNPDANQQPSMYLTPRYEYNSRRFNENLNLTRRSNAKPISTELLYSNEENDIKFNLQDAIRHPVDLKSKIKRNSLIFDKVQNGRRQMAPVDRISLRDESNYSDDEGTIKSNIYKVFNKNN